MDCATWIISGADTVGQMGTAHGGLIFQGIVAADEFCPVAGYGTVGSIDCEKGNPVREFGIVGVSGKKSATDGIDFSHNTHLGFFPQFTHDPFDVACRRQ